MNFLIVLVILIVSFLILGAIIRVAKLPLFRLMLVAVGAILGLLLGALCSIPLAHLPDPLGSIMPAIVSLILTIGVVMAVLSQGDVIMEYLPWLQKLSDKLPETELKKTETGKTEAKAHQILVDTSVIIDGRIADIAAAGFMHAKLIVPRFVLAELQNIADSEEAMRRSRGRRGLEVLNQLRENREVEVEISSEDVPGVKEVDAKLVALGKRLGADVLTTDYNLNRVAQIEGIRVLNVNELANAIRPVVLPGEEMAVKIVQAGKEKGQGVGYLPDGTMIVVEQGDSLIGQEVMCEVTRVFQTVAGKMIFAQPKQPISDLAAKKPKK